MQENLSITAALPALLCNIASMSVPEKLADWTLPALMDLLESGHSESDRFDFKEKINEGHPKSAERLRAVCCSFANASGGFLVFGVADQGAGASRIVGLPRSTEYGAALANATRTIEPALVLHVQNPHLALPNGNVLVVCEIPRGRRGPHWCDHTFYRRTQSTSIRMSYEEVRMAFLDHDERVGRIRLVYLSLVDNWIRLEDSVKPGLSGNVPMPMGGLDLTQVRVQLGEVQLMCPDLVGPLLMILRECDAIDARIRLLVSSFHGRFEDLNPRVKRDKHEIGEQMKTLGPRIDHVLREMQKRFGFDSIRARQPHEPAIPPIPTCWPV